MTGAPLIRPWIATASAYSTRPVSPIEEEESDVNSLRHEVHGLSAPPAAVPDVVVVVEPASVDNAAETARTENSSCANSIADFSGTHRFKPSFTISSLLLRLARPSRGQTCLTKSPTPPNVRTKNPKDEPITSIVEEYSTKDSSMQKRAPVQHKQSIGAPRSYRPLSHLRISAPTNFRHLTHAGHQEFSNITSRSQSDLVADFSTIRASQNSRDDLRGIQTQELQPYHSSARVVVQINPISETSSLGSCECPSLASESCGDSMHSTQASSQNSQCSSEAAARSPMHSSHGSFSFSRPFQYKSSRTESAPEVTPLMTGTVHPAFNLDQSATLDALELNKSQAQSDASSLISSSLSSNSEYRVPSFDYSPTTSSTQSDLESVNDVDRLSVVDLPRGSPTTLAPPPLRVSSKRLSRQNVLKVANRSSFEEFREPRPPFSTSSSSRPPSSESGSTITPTSPPQPQPSREHRESIRRSCLSPSKLSVSFDKRVSIIEPAKDSAGLFSAWGLDDDESEHDRTKISSPTSIGVTRPGILKGPVQEDTDDQLTMETYHRLDRSTSAPHPRRKSSLASNASSVSRYSDWTMRRSRDVSSISEDTSTLQQSPDEPKTSLFPLLRPPRRGLHRMHRSNNDLDLARSIDLRRDDAAVKFQSKQPGSRVPWSPILSKDIEGCSVGAWDQRTFGARCFPNTERGYNSGVSTPTQATNTSLASDGSSLSGSQAIVAAKTLDAWETGVARINVATSVSGTSDESNKLGGKRPIRMRSFF